MPVPPVITPEQRAIAQAASLEARKLRAVVRHDLKSGEMTLEDVLRRGHRGMTDELGNHARIYGRMRIGSTLRAVRGIGPVWSARILEGADLTGKERLDQLSNKKVKLILDATAPIAVDES